MAMGIQIVEASPKDLKKLQEIARRTFFESFAAVNTTENMQFYLDHHFSDELLSAEFMNPDSRFFFAHLETELIGYLKINRGAAQTILPNDQGLEIERIYVDQSFKGKGFGKLFIEKTVNLAKESGAKYIWLGVWEHNDSARRFYEKNGFITFSKHLFKLGDDEQTDLLMKRSIST
jgi:diamine N-acetyltransferase